MQDGGEASANSGSQGVQYGSGNVQLNAWTVKTSLDPVSLCALNTSRAVTRIHQASHDDAVDCFARASPNDVDEILKSLLRTDESKAVAVLSDLKPQKARELIHPLASDLPWLADLPKAADEIAVRAAEMELGDDHEAGKLTRVPGSLAGRGGYFRAYKKGVIYWADGNSCAVSGQIADYYAAKDGPCGALGFPLEDATSIESLHGASGTEQKFENGIICSSDLGTYAVCGKFDVTYQSAGGAEGWLGFPDSSQESDGPDELGRDVAIQRFEGGLICLSAFGTFPVRSEVARCAKGWLPESLEVDTGRSPISKKLGKMQRFGRAPRIAMTVYSSESTGIHCVSREILKCYENRKGPTSELGFPMSEVSVVQKLGWFQDFEGGRVYVKSGSRTVVVVPAPTVDLLKMGAAGADRIGWPVSEEKSVGDQDVHGRGERMQYFEHGVVTGQGRSREIWVRP